MLADMALVPLAELFSTTLLTSTPNAAQPLIACRASDRITALSIVSSRPLGGKEHPVASELGQPVTCRQCSSVFFSKEELDRHLAQTGHSSQSHLHRYGRYLPYVTAGLGYLVVGLLSDFGSGTLLIGGLGGYFTGWLIAKTLGVPMGRRGRGGGGGGGGDGGNGGDGGGGGYGGGGGGNGGP